MAKQLKLMLNIGKPDAQRLGIDQTKAGDIVTPGSQEAYDEMVAKRWGLDPEEADAELAASNVAPPVPLVPATPAVQQVQSTPEAVDYNAMTKEQLKDFADQRGIADVSMDLHKDEMVRIVKKATRAR